MALISFDFIIQIFAISYLSQLLVRSGDEDGVEYRLVCAPLALAGVSQGFGVGFGRAFVHALVLVAVGHAQGDAQTLEVARCVALQVRF